MGFVSNRFKACRSFLGGRRSHIFNVMWCRSFTNVWLFIRFYSRACVSRFFHDCVYQDGVWSRAFFQEEPDALAPVLQNESLRVMYNLINPSPYRGSGEVKNEENTEKGDQGIVEGHETADPLDVQQSSKHSKLLEQSDHSDHSKLLGQSDHSDHSDHSDLQDGFQKKSGNATAFETLDKDSKKENENLLKDLSLLYKITEKQGWYKNKKDQCYFIRFKDLSKKSMDILFPAISSSELDSLIRQA